jgi:hypothetical protein
MSFILKYSAKAEAEYFNAFDYYEDELKGLGDRFEQSVATKINQIIKTHINTPVKDRTTGSAGLKSFHFLTFIKYSQ